ncbi:MAG: flagellar biosynthetic protein FliO [bacterium]
MYWNILYILFVLAVLTGVMYSLLYLVKKFMYKYENTGNKGINIKVLGVHAILPKKYIAIVKIQDKVYLLGVSENSINVIDELENVDTNEEVEKNKPNTKFIDILKQNMGIK